MKENGVPTTPSPLETSLPLSASSSSLTLPSSQNATANNTTEQVEKHGQGLVMTTQELVNSSSMNPFAYAYVAVQLRTEKFDTHFFSDSNCTDVLMQAMNGTLRLCNLQYLVKA